MVTFEGVSKRYHLGLTRISLPSLASRWIRSRVGNVTRRTSSERVIWALRDVSFRLPQGESLALIGPNGAGKTTILKLLANITKPTTGKVEVDGRLSALIELGAGFHPELTGRDNVFLNGTILGVKREEIRKRFDEIVDFSGLERFIDTPVKRYSSGMVVRLGFAVAACIDPEILLVDEVLAVGDASFAQKCLDRIKSLLANGTAIIFVSHHLYLVKAVCREAMYLRHGHLQCTGATNDVIAAYERDLHAEEARRYGGPSSSPPSAAGEIEITDIQIVTRDGAPIPASICGLDPLEVRVSYASSANIGRAQMSVFLRRSDGLTCCMSRTSLDGFELEVRRGRDTVSLDLQPLRLAGGRYCFEAFVLDESDSLILTPAGGRSSWFSVVARAPSSDPDRGVFEPVGKWSHPVGPLAEATEGSALPGSGGAA